MPIDRAAVDHVALLARLELGEEERDRFQEQLGAILEHVAILARLDLAGVPPTSHVVPVVNVLRADAPTPVLDRAEVLDQAPDVADGAFRVPRVLEEP